ncbi:MAG: beta-galactosidase [Acidimicrobiales bacterium]
MTRSGAVWESMLDQSEQRAVTRRVRYGADYNPEQWPRAVWEEDVRLMGEAGVDLVTVGVFSWALLEPKEGLYSFDWLRDVLDLLAGAGIGVDLATPTAAPPAWLSARYLDVLPVDRTGVRYSYGSRQSICICSPTYREKVGAIVTRLVAEVGDHEAIEMWHVHNEYACHVPYCYCDHHGRAFRQWLVRRYGSLDAINQAWGTTFWSQSYTDLDQVVPPRMTAAVANPALELDYKRFCSDAFLEEFLEERAILKAARPELLLTTNFMGLYKPLDYFRWAAQVDIVSTDNYTDPATAEWQMRSAMDYDVVRGLNKKVPWMVMEQAPTRVNWRPHNVPKGPGHMRTMSYQAIARGATGVLFFQWRASRKGAEMFHSAMVSHAGTASPVWSEVVALGKELAGLEDLMSAPVEAKVAIVHSWPNWWAVESPVQPAGDLSVADQLFWVYRPLYEAGVTVDFCSPDECLDRYEAVLVPSLYLLSEPQAANLVSYVEAGGTVVVSFWSGIVDEHDAVYLGPYGGPLRPLMGCDVLDVAPIPVGETLEFQWDSGENGVGDFWADVLAERDGQVVARITRGALSGRPVVVETTYGRGRTYYVGCRLGPNALAHLFARVPALRGKTSVQPGSGVERVVRVGDDARYEFLINHSAEERKIDVAAHGLELLTGMELGSFVALKPAGVAIIRHAGIAPLRRTG